MPRYWYDSIPGVKVETDHPWLDPFGTPYEGPEAIQYNSPHYATLDGWNDVHAPYTSISQNRGGRS